MFAITKAQIAELEEVAFPGKVILVDTAAKALSAVQYLRKVKRIGFDTETRPSFQRAVHYTVSLVQLSTADECFLFRTKLIGGLGPLISLLEDPKIEKIGLSTQDDFCGLRRIVPEFKPEGFVELQQMVKDYDIADLSLQKIYALLFGRRISKAQRLTNWEAEHLTESQQRYAAIDAWACLRIYEHFQRGGFHPEDCRYIAPEPEEPRAESQELRDSRGATTARPNPEEPRAEGQEPREKETSQHDLLHEG